MSFAILFEDPASVHIINAKAQGKMMLDHIALGNATRTRVKIGLANLADNFTRLAWLNRRTVHDETRLNALLRSARPHRRSADPPEIGSC